MDADVWPELEMKVKLAEGERENLRILAATFEQKAKIAENDRETYKANYQYYANHYSRALSQLQESPKQDIASLIAAVSSTPTSVPASSTFQNNPNTVPANQMVDFAPYSIDQLQQMTASEQNLNSDQRQFSA